jgi:hypothetical protein
MIIALTVLAALTGIVVGFLVGEKHGRDSQFVDDFIESGLREMARRDKLGRFKAQGKTEVTP